MGLLVGAEGTVKIGKEGKNLEEKRKSDGVYESVNRGSMIALPYGREGVGGG